ncbi:DsrE family protein [Actinobacteria bacterium OK074]|nr:DsrE family protein [Actinobacteria bacterium OK074]
MATTVVPASPWERQVGLLMRDHYRATRSGPHPPRPQPRYYPAPMPKKLVIKVTAGADAPERCSQAFTVAAVAVASGVEVSLWLTGESAWFALPGRAAEFELPHAAPLPDLLDSVLAGGTLTLCTQCAARRNITEKDVLDGVRIAGAQLFVQEALADDTQALVY